MTIETQFAIGDRVRLIKASSEKYLGLTGVVTKITKNYHHVDVDPSYRMKIAGYSSGEPWKFFRKIWKFELETPAGPEPYEEWFKS